MIIQHHRSFAGTLLLVVALVVLFTAPAQAIRNVCRTCQARAELTDVVCPNCGHPMNLCLHCNHQNPVSEDYCLVCLEPLAESRLLGDIASDVREDLRLGQSPRAELERELSKIQHLLEVKPDHREILMFQRGKLLHQMNFFSREAEAWEEFLNEFPESRKKTIAAAYRSEALRQWAYLLYTQKEWQPALEKFEQATVCNPGNVEAWLWVGRVRHEQNDLQGAREAYGKAFALEPNNATAKHFQRLLSRPLKEKK